MQWFERQRSADLFISVISVGELERGVARQRSSNPEFAAALAAGSTECRANPGCGYFRACPAWVSAPTIAELAARQATKIWLWLGP
jgi:hypothetical protein